MKALRTITDHIRRNGPIAAARVSSAQAKGAAKGYAYWGVADYEVRLRKSDGVPVCVATSRAGSDRRSLRLAFDDLRRYCEQEGRVEITTIGEVSEVAALNILEQLEDSASASLGAYI